TRITVTLPSDQVAELRKLTVNVSGYVADAFARQIRVLLLGDDMRRHEDEHEVGRAACWDRGDGEV
ncbi:type II toxin-antitoxin system CcdA family antitoxin, partial [Streptomyces sp. BE230]|uniref:type II toxin-antitoxin system CcdA family antitoxin n=1 Tax=Streptomyces sp. BE230 TaxID=3002526 RepID=UPI002ED46ED3|nr:type II toxin-antitoxin system CcdA family antitoxin [Streptomyces sp. BE230]